MQSARAGVEMPPHVRFFLCAGRTEITYCQEEIRDDDCPWTDAHREAQTYMALRRG